VKLALKKGGELWEAPASPIFFEVEEVDKKMSEWMDSREHHRALETLWGFVHQVNLFLNERAPWKLAEGSEELKAVLYQALHGIHAIGVLSQAFLPAISREVLETLGSREFSDADSLKNKNLRFRLKDPAPLFPKIEVQEASL
jgi:methionyl-tRNA synthetase